MISPDGRANLLGCITASSSQQQAFVGDWVVSIICPYCQQTHVHSAPEGPGHDPGFRIAHCRLDRKGYYIAEASPPDQE